MLHRQPLARRILWSFTLLTLLVAGVYAWAIIAVVHVVEEDLIGEEMRAEMAGAAAIYAAEGRIPDLTGSSRLYVPDLGSSPLPTEFETSRPGFQEILAASGAWHVLETSVEGHRFVLVRNQDFFEAREQMLGQVVLGGLLCAVLLAAGIGRLTVRRVIDPVIRLADQVRDRDQVLPLAPPLALDYSNDELGRLAKAFDQAFSRLHAVVDRERLFTSDVSHELRTPLMIVASSAELLAREELSPRARRQVGRIALAAGEMQSLVDTFLELARAQASTSAPAARVSLAQMAAEQVARWQPEIEARGLAFTFSVEGQLSGLWHPTLLRVVMSNLLRNALHYTDQGSIRLIIGDTGFRVEDTGPGIPPEELDNLFQPFVRGRRARGEGLGLGLSLVRRICEQQGWQIEATQLAAGGCCFSVRLCAV